MLYVIVLDSETSHYQPCLLIESGLGASALADRLAAVRPVYYHGLLDATTTDSYAAVPGVRSVTVVERLTPSLDDATPPYGQPAVT